MRPINFQKYSDRELIQEYPSSVTFGDCDLGTYSTISSLYSTYKALFFLERTIPFCKSKASLEFIPEFCVNKIFVDSETQAVSDAQSDYGLDKYAKEGSSIKTQRWIMETNKVSSLGIYLHGRNDKSFAGLRAGDLAPCKLNIEGEHFAIAAKAFSTVNDPIFCDENAAKYFQIKALCKNISHRSRSKIFVHFPISQGFSIPKQTCNFSQYEEKRFIKNTI